MKPRPEDLTFESLAYAKVGGQQIYPNQRSSGVRVTHTPTETVVEVCIHRSQLHNKRLALEMIEWALAEL